MPPTRHSPLKATSSAMIIDPVLTTGAFPPHPDIRFPSLTAIGPTPTDGSHLFQNVNGGVNRSYGLMEERHLVDHSNEGGTLVSQMEFQPNFQTPPLGNPIHPPGFTHYFHTQHQARPLPLNFNRIPDWSQDYVPRPHPHLPAAILFLANVPPDLPEGDIAGAVRECMPVRIQLEMAVPPQEKVKPDAYYNWMPRQGLLQFDSLHNAEKALATLPVHPLIVQQNLFISPYPVPQTLPFAEPICPARFIRPIKLVMPVRPTTKHRPAEEFMSRCPSPGELFDTLRRWGSIRQVSVWAEHGSVTAFGNPEESFGWAARVEFWFDDEATRFQVGFGQTGSTVKGWQIYINAERIHSHMVPDFRIHQSQPLLLPTELPPTPQDLFFPVHRQGPLPLAKDMQAQSSVPCGQSPYLGVAPPSTFNTFSQSAHLPPTPPLSAYPLPWSGHVPFTTGSSTPALDSPSLRSHKERMQPKLTMLPAHSGARLRKGSKPSLPSAAITSRKMRHWSVTVDAQPDGELRATGLQGDDGTFIKHGPGQHIRPAPPVGPGSCSSSGLVDYSNVFVKNLDSDITSYSLSELFSNVGRIVSARVMRDEGGKSRGYGFVSFEQPDDAAHAIQQMNGEKVGSQTLSVTLHEPRKLRPEKLAERAAAGIPISFGRQAVGLRRSSSPLRTDRRGRKGMLDEPDTVGNADTVQLLSPATRKVDLAKRVVFHVRQYAAAEGISQGLVNPTINALVKLDLEIVPLLRNPEALKAKITETISELQDDPEFSLTSGSTINLPQANHLATTPGDQQQLRTEIQHIDPLEVDKITAIMLKTLDPPEVARCLSNKRFLVTRYNAAKKEYLRAQLRFTPAVVSMDIDDLESIEYQQSAESEPNFTALSVDTITLESLAALPIPEIMANLCSPAGDAILSKLELSRPTAKDAAAIAVWTRKVTQKSRVEAKTEIAAAVVKKLDINTLKRSEKLRVAKEVVNSVEDNETICQLLLYPALLNAKIWSFTNPPKRPSSA